MNIPPYFFQIIPSHPYINHIIHNFNDQKNPIHSTKLIHTIEKFYTKPKRKCIKPSKIKPYPPIEQSETNSLKTDSSTIQNYKRVNPLRTTLNARRPRYGSIVVRVNILESLLPPFSSKCCFEARFVRVSLCRISIETHIARYGVRVVSLFFNPDEISFCRGEILRPAESWPLSENAGISAYWSAGSQSWRFRSDWLLNLSALEKCVENGLFVH